MQPLARLEIISVNPDAKRPVNALAKHWLDIDNDALQAVIARVPCLVHFDVKPDDIQAASKTMKAHGIGRRPAVQAKRHSRKGLLQWQIALREDGQRLFNGALPNLIQWGKPDNPQPLRLHPRNSLPRSGVCLQDTSILHPNALKLQAAAAYWSIGLGCFTLHTGPARISPCD